MNHQTTYPFCAVNRLADHSLRHNSFHDLESVLWVLVYVTINKIFDEREAASQSHGWSRGKLTKQRFIHSVERKGSSFDQRYPLGVLAPLVKSLGLLAMKNDETESKCLWGLRDRELDSKDFEEAFEEFITALERDKPTETSWKFALGMTEAP